MADDTCQCPKCGRLHRDLGFGAPPGETAGARTDYAWVIESAWLNDGDAPKYFTGTEGSGDGLLIGWSDDHAQAIRFAREVDARKIARTVIGDHDVCAWKIVEHGWDTTASPAAPPAQSVEHPLDLKRPFYEAPITDAEEELIGNIRAVLYNVCENHRTKPDAQLKSAEHDAVCRQGRRLVELEERYIEMAAELDRLTSLNAQQAPEIERLNTEIGRRKGDPLTRLHNIIEGVEEVSGAFSADEFHRLDDEVLRLQKLLADARAFITENTEAHIDVHHLADASIRDLVNRASTAETSLATAQFDLKATMAEIEIADGVIESFRDRLGAAQKEIDRLSTSRPAVQGGEDAVQELEKLRTDPLWLVWSNEHGAWWGPDNRGYTTKIQNAGRYTLAAAQSCCGHRDKRQDGGPDELVAASPELITGLFSVHSPAPVEEKPK